MEMCKKPTMKTCLAICAILIASTARAAPTTASSTATAQPVSVSYLSDKQSIQALLYLPSGGGKHPAVIVIHEWWGLVDWIKQQASDYAAQGYVVLAVDLYRGQTAADPDTAHELMRGLPQDRGVRDLTAAFTYLQSRPDVNRSRIAAVGWCMGGGYAAQLAIAEPTLRSVAINYGSLPTDPASIGRIHAQVLGNFGGLDKGITAADVETFAAAVKSNGIPVNVKVYPNSGHAFENPANKTGYRPEDAADATHRISSFLASTLK
jgi:carboxymethylenebutenolidase